MKKVFISQALEESIDNFGMPVTKTQQQKKSDFNLDLPTVEENSAVVEDFSIKLNKAHSLENTEFRKVTYICSFLKKTDREEVKNRFNILPAQIPVFRASKDAKAS